MLQWIKKLLTTNSIQQQLDTFISSKSPKSPGALYSQLDFSLVSSGKPSYWYLLPNQSKRIHRYKLRKNLADNPALTEYQNRLLQGYLRIWDCGHSRWIWTQK